MRRLLAILAMVWAIPWTAVGLLVGTIGLLTGGGGGRRGRTVGFWGRAVAWLLRRCPIAGGAAALTLGHVVLARTRADFDACWDHEFVHVRQYERWGPFFVPAYFLCSLALLLARRNPYRDNPFEVEAFRASSRRGSP